LDRFLNLVKDDKAGSRNHDCGCAGKQESVHGNAPQEMGV